MYEGYKFQKIEQIVLYLVAEKIKPTSQKIIYSELPEIEKNTIDSAFRKLEKQNLIKRGKGKKENNFVGLNTKKMAMDKIKNLLKEHWEINWQGDWENAPKI